MNPFPISVVIYSHYTHSRFIDFPDVSAISSITTTNDTSLIPLINGEYTNITTDENTALHTLGYIRMNIFSDGSGNNYALDSNNNPITSRLVVNTIYTYPYTDSSANSIDGYLTIYFDDGSFFGNNDTNDLAFWYTIDGLPLVYKQFT
jgi:hypothetical protein